MTRITNGELEKIRLNFSSCANLEVGFETVVVTKGKLVGLKRKLLK